MKKIPAKQIFFLTIIVSVMVLGAGLFSMQVEQSDLLQPRSITGEGIYHNSIKLIIDGSFSDEASPWNGEQCVYWEDETASFLLDMGEEFIISGVLIQADDNDDYRIEYSSDGIEFTALFIFYAGYNESGKGMDSMSSDPESPFYVNIPGMEPVHARYLRIQASGGDSSYAVSELQIFGSELSGELDLPTGGSQLIRPAAIRGEGDYNNSVEIIIDGRIPPEGSEAEGEMSVFWEEIQTFFVVDLGQIVNVSGIIIQVDGNDSLRIDYSIDDQDYIILTEIKSTDGEISSGMDSLSSLPENAEYINELEFFPVDARYIKLYAVDGEGVFAVSEVQIYARIK